MWDIGAGVELNGVEIVGIGNDGKWKWKTPRQGGRKKKELKEDTLENVNLVDNME